jgi:Methyltransferase domain
VIACPICRATSGRVEHREPALEVWRCGGCGHRRATHAAPASATDYYENTPQDERFVASLRVTRERQAREILGRVGRAALPAGDWLDFGAGRGWFLRVARAAGVAPVSGFDTSRLATESLSADGFAMARASTSDPFWPDWSSLPRAPRVVFFLDVIEHFEGEEARRALVRLRAELPALEAVVIKVPAAEGVFFRAARALKAVAPAPYRQLFQVGTVPPHEHYFCRRSFETLLGQTGFSIVDAWGDRDVDDLFQRIPPLAHWPGGRWASRAAGLFPADARVAIARVSAGSS